MIRNDEQCEAALEEVVAALDDPPEPGTPEERRFHALLADIEAYRPTIEPPPQSATEPPGREHLRNRVAAFQRRLRSEGPPSLMRGLDTVIRPLTGR